MEKLTNLPPDINTHWRAIAPLLTIRNEQDYDRAVRQLNDLIDEIGTDEKHPLYDLLDTLGTLIEAYEADRHLIPNCGGSDVLAYLIEDHQLSLSDLPEIGTPEAIAAILNKERALNPIQIQQLARRFQIQPQVFVN